MSPDDTKAYLIHEIIKLVNHLLPLDRWGFKQSACFFVDRAHLIVIYQSEKCRIKVTYEDSPRIADQFITVHYGSVEVPDKADVLLGADQQNIHLLWHSVRIPLLFLDGLSPQEARITRYPRLIDEFSNSDLAKKITYQPEKDILLQATIWETYGQKLFDVFDTRNNDLWKRYVEFISDCWKAPLI